MIARGTLVYRCRACSKEFAAYTVPNVVATLATLASTGGAWDPRTVGEPVRMTTTHHCGDGRYGVCDLICGTRDLGPSAETTT